MLRIGLFNFRNDDVLLIAGDKASVAALGSHLRAEFERGKSCVAVHDIALASKRHPAMLYAVQGHRGSHEKNALIWSCSEHDIERLLAAGQGPSELHFELSKTPPYFHVNFSGHYDEAWWRTFG
jgi:hypothetical protein